MLTVKALETALEEILPNYQDFYQQFKVFQVSLKRVDLTHLPYLYLHIEPEGLPVVPQRPEAGAAMCREIKTALKNMGAEVEKTARESRGGSYGQCLHLGEAAIGLEVGEEDVVLFSHQLCPVGSK